MVARHFSRNRQETKSLRYVGVFDVRGRRVSVAVDYTSPHLANLPSLYLIDRLRDLPEAIAHVENDDRVCYAREEELVLDPHNPLRWSRFTGQFGGKAKMDFKFDYAASFSSFSCVA
jgi:hypothetical protein